MKNESVKEGTLVKMHTETPTSCSHGIIEYVGSTYCVVRDLDEAYEDNEVYLVRKEEYWCWDLLLKREVIFFIRPEYV